MPDFRWRGSVIRSGSEAPSKIANDGLLSKSGDNWKTSGSQKGQGQKWSPLSLLSHQDEWPCRLWATLQSVWKGHLQNLGPFLKNCRNKLNLHKNTHPWPQPYCTAALHFAQLAKDLYPKTRSNIYSQSSHYRVKSAGANLDENRVVLPLGRNISGYGVLLCFCFGGVAKKL